MRKEIYLFLLGIILSSVSLSAQKLGILNREKANKIDRLLQLYNSFGDISGSVLVAQDGKIIYKNAFGDANREWEVKNTIDTKYRIGSLTKQFTAVMVLQLVDEDQLKLKNSIADYLPYYRKDIGQKITITDLLNHTSGIPDYTQRPDFLTSLIRSYIPTEELITKYCSDELLFEPGERFEYSNSGYAILGAIIETVTKKSYEDNIKERITDPLKMTETGFDSPYTIIPKRASGYQKYGFQYINAMFIDMSIINATGGLYSTIEDLYKWERAFQGNVLLPRKLKKKMFSLKNGVYSFGWYIEDTPINVNGSETLKAYHTGGIPGFKSMIIRLIEDNHTIIILCNNGHIPVEDIAEKIQLTLYDMPYDLPRKSIIPIMLQSIEKQGVDIAIKEYKKLKIAQESIWTFRVNELDDLGNELLKLNKVEAAIQIFKLNTEEFPEHYITYHSLADIYRKQGETAKAIENYKKTIQLNPKNTKAQASLRILEN